MMGVRDTPGVIKIGNGAKAAHDHMGVRVRCVLIPVLKQLYFISAPPPVPLSLPPSLPLLSLPITYSRPQRDVWELTDHF